MLRWHGQLYYGATARKKAPGWIRKINQGKPVLGAYLVTLSHNSSNVLELTPALALLQEPMKRICPEIIGIANGKDEGLELIQTILEEVYSNTGTFRVDEYLKKEE